MLCQAERAGKAGYYVAIAVTDPLHFYFRRNKMMKGIQVNCAWMPFEILCIFVGLGKCGDRHQKAVRNGISPVIFCCAFKLHVIEYQQ